jgi:hypothetical protein
MEVIAMVTESEPKLPRPELSPFEQDEYWIEAIIRGLQEVAAMTAEQKRLWLEKYAR